MKRMKKHIPKRIKRVYWAIKLFLTRLRYGNPSRSMKIVGVTGTNGKTTISTLLYEIAMGLGEKAGRIGTGDIFVGEEKLELDRKIPTTPDSVTLTKIFHQMKKAGCKYVFMEVSSHAVSQSRLDGIKFTGGIFTNLTQDHLDYHGDFENYFLAKRKFFQMLPKDSWALSNDDDDRGEAILATSKAQKYFYSLKNTEPTCHAFEEGSFCGQISKMDFGGVELQVGEDRIKSKLLGEFNAYNLLAVWSASQLLGFDKEKTKEIIVELEAPAGRFEKFLTPSGVMVVVDYAHTPDALENVLKTANGIKGEGRLISLVGCGGDRDIMKRPKMGRIGAELSDVCIFTSDNPRSEKPEQIIEHMKQGLKESLLKKVKEIPDRREAIKEARDIAKKGDVILIAGKGHETYQEIKGKKYPFNDMEEVKKIGSSQK